MHTSATQELFKEYIEELTYTKKMSPQTIMGAQVSFNLLMKFRPELKLEDIDRKTMSEYFKFLETRVQSYEGGRLKRGVKSSTIATRRAKLNGFFNWLVIKRYLKENPFDTMLPVRVLYEDKKYLSQEEVQRILYTVDTIEWSSRLARLRNKAIFYTLLFSGIRKGELMGLRAEDVDLKKRTLYVRPETSKSRRGRTLPLHRQAVEVLEQYMKQREKKHTCAELWVSASSDHGLTSHGLKHMVSVVKETSGVNFHLHRFRHTFAVNLLRNKTNVAYLQKLMGHQDLRMTDAYLRCTPMEDTREDVDMLNLNNLM